MLEHLHLTCSFSLEIKFSQLHVCQSNFVNLLALYEGQGFIKDDVLSFLHNISSLYARIVRRLLLLFVVVRERALL